MSDSCQLAGLEVAEGSRQELLPRALPAEAMESGTCGNGENCNFHQKKDVRSNSANEEEKEVGNPDDEYERGAYHSNILSLSTVMSPV